MFLEFIVWLNDERKKNGEDEFLMNF